MEPLLVIKNSDAGTADEQTLERGLAVLRARTSVEVAGTSDPGELNGVLHRAGSRRIVVAGGDGSLHAVVSALHRRNELSERTLALLPLGTGNDFARGNDIPLDIEEAARVVLSGEPPSPATPPVGCRFSMRCPYAEPRCHEEEPQLRSIDGDHHVACHLV